MTSHHNTLTRLSGFEDHGDRSASETFFDGNGTTVDGAACMPHMGRPRLVRVITLSSSQRGACEPGGCLRESVSDTSQHEDLPAFIPGRMSLVVAELLQPVLDGLWNINPFGIAV
jgi:hypothetical protein